MVTLTIAKILVLMSLVGPFAYAASTAAESSAAANTPATTDSAVARSPLAGSDHVDVPDDLSLKTAKIAPVDDAWRKQLPRDPEAATNAYMARLTPAAKARSDAYFEGGYWVDLWSFLLSLGIAWLLLASKISLRVRQWTERTVKVKAIQYFLYAVFFCVAMRVFSFPLSLYTDFFREHQYGLSNLSFWGWMKELGIELGVSCVMTGVAIAALYTAIRKFPKNWHVVGTVLAIVFMSFAILVEPTVVDPLFNHYTSLEAGPTKDAILSMARASGVPATDVYQFDASKQSDRVSANVSGIFGSAAIRLNDNLLRRTTLAEIKGVMGHEMGHYVMNHVYKMIVEFTLMILVAFAWLKWSFTFSRNRYGKSWGIEGVDDIAGLPLMSALLTIFFFVLTPINNTLIRTQEVEADIFGLNASREPDGFAEVDLKLTEYRKSDPGPIEEFIFFDHPSPRKRVFSAMRWKAENWPNGTGP